MRHDIDRTQVRYAKEDSCHDHGGSAFDEMEHNDLAADLLEVNSDEELEAFLDDAISAAAHAVGGFINPSVRNALLQKLKGLARHYLPIAAEAMERGGNHDPEELEWEAAHTVVKLAGEATHNAAHMPPSGNDQADAHAALADAIQAHAPHLAGFLPGREPKAHGCQCQHKGEHHREHRSEGRGGASDSGRWYRDGKHIVLSGI